MTLDAKYEHQHAEILQDTRPWREKIKDKAREPSNAALFFTIACGGVYIEPILGCFSDLIFIIMSYYFYWLVTQPVNLPFKMPMSAKIKDPNNIKPGGGTGMAEGIMYLGNSSKKGEEIWFSNNDARTHILYLGTTGSGKTEGLKSISCNALCWASGYVYIDGKADTDLWSMLSNLARRFGRDDDLLLMNYMTGNAGGRVPSNTLNPFSSGSASYITNMLVSLMPEAGGDNSMWKDRAVSLVSAIMPALVWIRDNHNMPLSIGVIRAYLTLQAVIKLSRNQDLPDVMRTPIKAYLEELPGYVDDVFDDDGNEKQMGPDAGAVDTSTPRQQHGYLSMQFTRSMSSLAEDYGFIFDTQAADVDMLDVVLNRRLLIVLIPALEKSGDETANLGKIISSTLKGMMGATLGSTVEGDTATAIENKPTKSSTPFIAIFDEVGYYAAQGMAVMAAQARSLGFCLVFAGQDMPALEKRVKEEARSITANCNIKLFGKLEDPTQTKEFFEKSVGQAIVTEASGYEKGKKSKNASIQVKARASYDELKSFTEGQCVCAFGKNLAQLNVYYSSIGHGKAMRVHRFLAIPPPSEDALKSLHQVDAILNRFRNPDWSAEGESLASNEDITALAEGFTDGLKTKIGLLESGAMAIAKVAQEHSLISTEEFANNKESAAPASDVPKAAKTEPAADKKSPIIKPNADKIIEDAVTSATAGVMSWGDLLGMPSAEDSIQQDSADDSYSDYEDENHEPDNADIAALDAALKQTTPSLPVEKQGPISWNELLGIEDEDDNTTEIAEPIQQYKPVAEGESQIPAEETPAIMPDTTKHPISANTMPASEPISEITVPDSITERPAKIISWGDIIGVAGGKTAAPPQEVTDNNIPANTVPAATAEQTADPENISVHTAVEETAEKKPQTVGWADVITMAETERSQPTAENNAPTAGDEPEDTPPVEENSNAINWQDLAVEQNTQNTAPASADEAPEEEIEVAKTPISWSDLIGINIEEDKDTNSGRGDL